MLFSQVVHAQELAALDDCAGLLLPCGLRCSSKLPGLCSAVTACAPARRRAVPWACAAAYKKMCRQLLRSRRMQLWLLRSGLQPCWP